MKKLIALLLAAVMLLSFAACSEEAPLITTKGMEDLLEPGIVENGFYINKTFGVGFEIPDGWEAEKEDPSGNTSDFMDDWSFYFQNGFGSLDILAIRLADEKIPEEETLSYISEYAEKSYKQSMTEIKTATATIDGEEKEFVLVRCQSDGSTHFLGVTGKTLFAEGKTFLLWMCFLAESEETIVHYMEYLTFDPENLGKPIERTEEQGKTEDRKRIYPAIGAIENGFFKNDAFNVGFKLPASWTAYYPEEEPKGDTENFDDYFFCHPTKNEYLRIFYFLAPKENFSALEAIQLVLDSDFFSEYEIINVTIDGKEEKALWYPFESDGIQYYRLYVPKVIKTFGGTWICSFMFTSEDGEKVKEYSENATFDAENYVNINPSESGFEFEHSELFANLCRNKSTGISVKIPTGWTVKIHDTGTYYDGYFMDFEINDSYICNACVEYQSYGFYGKEETIESYLDSSYSNFGDFSLISREIYEMEYDGQELTVKTEILGINEDRFSQHDVIKICDEYLICFSMLLDDSMTLEEMLSYINFNYK